MKTENVTKTFVIKKFVQFVKNLRNRCKSAVFHIVIKVYIFYVKI